MSNTIDDKNKETEITDFSFPINKFISKGWELGLKILGWYVLYMTLAMTASSLLKSLPYVGSLINTLVIAPVLASGTIFFIHHRYTTNRSDFGLIFLGFKKNLLQIILLNLILVIGCLIIYLPLILEIYNSVDLSDFTKIANEKNPEALMPLVKDLFKDIGSWVRTGFFCSFGILFLMTFTVFTSFLVVLENYTAVKAISVSFKIVKKKFIKILWFLILLGLINLLGVLCLIIGLFITVPISFAAVYIAYISVFKPNLEIEDDVKDKDVLDS